MSLGRETKRPDPVAAPTRVLHVDDDPDFVDLTADFLEREGQTLEIVTATSAEEGLDVHAGGDIDCIVSDYQMPGTDGLEFLQAVRETDPDLPFILFTGKGSEEIASEAISVGVTDYLQKGTGLDQYTLLANRVENAVAKHRAEREIARTNRRYQTLIRESSDAIMVVDDRATFEYLSPAAERVLGYRPADLVGERGFDYVHPHDRAEAEQRFRDFVDGERSDAPLVFRFRQPDGSWIWLEVRTRNLLDDPLVGGIVVYARDVTQRHEQAARFEALIEHTSDVITVLDADGTIRFESPAVESVLGYEPDELVGTDVYTLIHPDDRERVADTFMQAIETDDAGPETVIYRARHADGSWVWLESVGHGDQVSFLDGYVATSRDISERKRQEARLESVIERVRTAIVEVDDEWRFTRVNEQAEDLYGMVEEDLLGRDFWDVFTEARGTRFEDEYRQVMETREPTSFVEYYDGLEGWFDIEVYPRDDGGIEFYFVEVTDLMDHQEGLEHQARRLDAYEIAFPDLAFIFDETGRYLDVMVGEGNEDLLYEDPSTLLGRRATEVLPDGVGRDFTAIVGRVIETGEAETYEYSLELPQGARWLEAIVEPLPFEYDGSEAAIWVSRDVTDRIQRERRFRSVFEDAFDAMVIANDDGEYTDVNAAACELFGLSEAELIGKRITDFAPDDFDFEAAWAEFQSAEQDRGTFPLVRPDGTRRTVEYAATPNIVPGEHLSVLRDVTERHQREEELARQRSLLKAQQESDIDGILVVDEDRTIISYNDRFVEMWGLPADALEANDDLVAIEHAFERVQRPTEFQETVQYLYEHPEERHRDEVELTDGRVFDRYSAPLVGEDDIYYGRLWTFRDITDRIEREDELSRKNDRLEEFASIVSHDLRNPLTVLQGSIDLAEETGDTEHFERARRATDRMNRLIDDLLTLAREGETVAEFELVGLADLVSECWHGLETADARLEVDTDRVVQADRSRLQQLIENLLRNAIQHAGEQCTVTVADYPDGFYFEDDGPGIPDERKESVFESGFSTDSDGTGFGLRIVEQIAEAHGWDVAVADGSNGGARFEFSGVSIDPDAGPAGGDGRSS